MSVNKFQLNTAAGTTDTINPIGLVMDAGCSGTCFTVGGGAGDGVHGTDNTIGADTAPGFTAIMPATWSMALGGFGAKYYGETNYEFFCGVSNGGAGSPLCQFGSGSATPDVSLQRTSAGVLTVTGYLAAKLLTHPDPLYPSFYIYVQSTNSGSTSGIPSGDNCLISYIYSGSAPKYRETAECTDYNNVLGPNMTVAWYSSVFSNIGSESFTLMGYITGAGDYANAHGVVIPAGTTGSTGSGKVVLSTGTGYSGSCASTTTLTVVNGIITGCS
jgi:hypothetical protein